MKYRLKPTTVFAYQVQPMDDEKTRQLPPPWLVGAIVDGSVTAGIDNTLHVHGHSACLGDYIIRSESGGLSAMKRAEFDALYEPVTQ